jgi:carboxymethylenebutenolidase
MSSLRAFSSGLAVAAVVGGLLVVDPPFSSARSADEANVASDVAAGVASGGSTAAAQAALPPDAEGALARLDASPRHGEWVTVSAGTPEEIKAWVVYPERADKAPVVVVVHEIFGLTHWVRAVADQLAADGFIAIAPDLLTSKKLPAGPNGPDQQAAVTAIRTLDPAVVQRQIGAAASYAMTLPAALPSYGVVGFCWGGSASFNHAVAAPGLDVTGFGGSVVYYGSSPATPSLASVKQPVLGLYGGNDARVNATIEPAKQALAAQGTPFEAVILDGAGHGFLRQQSGQDGANMRASVEAWPRTVAFFRERLGTR